MLLPVLRWLQTGQIAFDSTFQKMTTNVILTSNVNENWYSSQLALISSAAASVPAILSNLNQSYLQYNTRQVTSDDSTLSSRKGYDRYSVKYCGWSGVHRIGHYGFLGFVAIKVSVDDKEWGWDGPFVEVEMLADEEEWFRAFGKGLTGSWHILVCRVPVKYQWKGGEHTRKTVKGTPACFRK